jgi:hypothetical protein
MFGHHALAPRLLLILFCCSICLHSMTAFSRDLYVSVDALGGADDYINIQAAIDQVGHDDTIIVRDGVYTGSGNKNLSFNYSYPLTLTSENGPESTVIDCEGDGRGFTF